MRYHLMILTVNLNFCFYATATPTSCPLQCWRYNFDPLCSSNDRYLYSIHDNAASCQNLCYVGLMEEKTHDIKLFLECRNSTDLAVVLMEDPHLIRSHHLSLDMATLRIKKVNLHNKVVQILMTEAERGHLTLHFVDLTSILIDSRSWSFGTSVGDAFFGAAGEVVVVFVSDNDVFKNVVSVDFEDVEEELLFDLDADETAVKLEFNDSIVRLFFEDRDQPETFSIFDQDYISHRKKSSQKKQVFEEPSDEVEETPRNSANDTSLNFRKISIFENLLIVLLVLILVALICLLAFLWVNYKMSLREPRAAEQAELLQVLENCHNQRLSLATKWTDNNSLATKWTDNNVLTSSKGCQTETIAETANTDPKSRSHLSSARSLPTPVVKMPSPTASVAHHPVYHLKSDQQPSSPTSSFENPDNFHRYC